MKPTETDQNPQSNDQPRRKLRPALFRLLSVGVGLVVSLIAVETALRLFDIKPDKIRSKRQLVDLNAATPHYYHCYSANPNDELMPVPDVSRGKWELQTHTFQPQPIPLQQLQETPWCVEYNHSSQGIRDREYSAEPPAGVMRIAVVGDSFVFGEGVPEPLSLPRQIEQKLGKGYEVINGGEVGADTIRELQILSNIVGGTKCQRAIFVFIANDIQLSPYLANQQSYINDLINLRDGKLEQYESRSWYSGHLRLFELIGAPIAGKQIERETVEWYQESYRAGRNAENLRILRETIGLISQIPNCRTAFVMYPLLIDLDSGYPLEEVHATVSRMALDAGLPVLDLTPSLAGKPTEQLWVHASDHHPNGRAHAIAADTIVEWLSRDHPEFLRLTSNGQQ